jgi:thioredoxin 1
VSEKVMHVGDADFDVAVLQSSEPVLVDFWAELQSVQMIAPALDARRGLRRGQDRQVNVDHNRATAMKFHVRSIDTAAVQDGRCRRPRSARLARPLNQMLDKVSGGQAVCARAPGDAQPLQHEQRHAAAHGTAAGCLPTRREDTCRPRAAPS